ncbi:hypothetical protein BDB00DRAFT_811027, partial [Zychaea mexicana]|uniref:uncharacterized protein n=1 Tax=Zychaea mexicana TaxID=64656 RepID=UPI0022FF1C78
MQILHQKEEKKNYASMRLYENCLPYSYHPPRLFSFSHTHTHTLLSPFVLNI